MSERELKYLTDSFGRVHDYLRISLTEHCNLRCFYCMPEEGLAVQPKEVYLTADEIIKAAQAMTALGVNKIRLTGGEPLIRKDFEQIFRRLSELPVELALTTNGILVDRFIDLFKEVGLENLNVSLDSLQPEKNLKITKRDYFHKIWDNIELLLDEGFYPKLNIVLMRGVNDDEILDFIELTRDKALDVRFIEFMPFSGNNWERNKCFSLAEIMEKVNAYYSPDTILPLESGPNSTSKNYRIEGHKGSFGIISSVSEPFCSSCNRIRLTADGKLKNCLFSNSEFDLRYALRNQMDLLPTLKECISEKKAVRAGLAANDQSKELFESNRSMISIGG